MFDSRDIIETISMIREECLDIRTITMGISLYDCQSENPDRLCTRVYDRIMSKAANLVKTGEDIEKKYGIIMKEYWAKYMGQEVLVKIM